jgi:Holliday junction resolvase-like predicted endonuclease
MGEVDLMARDGETDMFVESKTRRAASYRAPEEAVTQSNARKLALTAQEYLQSQSLEEADKRIDVIGITIVEGASAVISLVRGVEVG